MKIGILTLYNADYGSYYQAVSLYDQLEKMGHSCELIHILNRETGIIKNLGGHIVAKYFPFIARKIAKKIAPYNTYLVLEECLKKYRISEITYSMKKISKQYDCIVVGADELWSATNPYVKYIRTYYGYHMECPHISYATSGISLGEPSPEILRQIQSDISGFTALGVRDCYTKEWIYNLTGRESSIVIDPTLLNPFFANESKTGSYMLVYGEHFEEEHIKAITEFAKRKNWTIRCVSWRHSWCEFIEVKTADELMEQFAEAAWCISSTFHGTIFSIVHKKNFTAFDTAHRGKKVKNLLQELELEQCLFDGQAVHDVYPNYNNVEKILKDKRKYALEYLEKAIKDIENILS